MDEQRSAAGGGSRRVLRRLLRPASQSWDWWISSSDVIVAPLPRGPCVAQRELQRKCCCVAVGFALWLSPGM